jgi:hypothetical protein
MSNFLTNAMINLDGRIDLSNFDMPSADKHSIPFPSYTLGLMVMYSPVSFLDIEYGCFNQDAD